MYQPYETEMTLELEKKNMNSLLKHHKTMKVI